MNFVLSQLQCPKVKYYTTFVTCSFSYVTQTVMLSLFFTSHLVSSSSQRKVEGKERTTLTIPMEQEKADYQDISMVSNCLIILRNSVRLLKITLGASNNDGTDSFYFRKIAPKFCKQKQTHLQLLGKLNFFRKWRNNLKIEGICAVIL